MLRRLNPSVLRLLRVFNAVARHRGFTAAETVLNIGQSTISRHVKDLENLVGYELCDRGRAGFRLTEAGQRLYESVQRLERDLAAFISSVNEIHDELRGSIRIGIPHVISRIPTLTGLHRVVGELRRDHPLVHVDIHLDSAREVEEGIVEGRYDMVMSAAHMKTKNIQFVPLFPMKIGLYCCKGHPLFDVPDAEITSELLLEHDGLTLMYETEHQRPYQSRAVMNLESSEVAIFYILSTAYVGYLSEYVAHEWVERGMLRPLHHDEFSYNSPAGMSVQKRSLDNPIVRLVMSVLTRLKAEAE
jgi:LysR family transcriptional regulator, transcriptional activator for bauABCD operon